MSKYYYSIGAEKFGPFTIEELKNKPIGLDTLVWVEGTSNWLEARHINELQALFTPVGPPPLPISIVPQQPNYTNPTYATTPVKRKSNFGLITIIIIGICMLVAGGIAISSQNNSGDLSFSERLVGNGSEREKTPEEIKADLKEREEADVLKYLSLDYKLEPNLGIRARITGVVHNSASIATYKDAVIRMTFLTKTETVIGTEDKTMFEYLKPSSSKTFDWRIRTPNKTALIGLQIVNASVAN